MSEEKGGEKLPQDTDYRQQRLHAWQPVLSVYPVVIAFFVIAAIAFILGGVIVVQSAGVKEIRVRYDQKCPVGAKCQTVLTIEEDMDGPLFFYYSIHNFYQNHRRYVRSRSDAQYAGTDIKGISTCEPLNSKPGGLTPYPCGLVAQSFFNDTFQVWLGERDAATQTGGVLLEEGTKEWDSTNIIWKGDRDKKFKLDSAVASAIRAVQNGSNPLPDQQYESILNTRGLTGKSVFGFELPPVDNPDFIVWMRMAGMPDFRKLHRKMDISLKKGDKITVGLTNHFNTWDIDGASKYFVISTTNWLGGKNEFLAWAYIAVGCVTVVLALVLWIRECISPANLADNKFFQ